MHINNHDNLNGTCIKYNIAYDKGIQVEKNSTGCWILGHLIMY